MEIVKSTGKDLVKESGSVSAAVEEVVVEFKQIGGSGKRARGAVEGEVRFNENNIKHIFRDKKGHFKVDTPEHRRILIETTRDKSNFLGTDQHGSAWYARITRDGKQIWTQVRNGEIRNAGINDIPRRFNSRMGLSSPVKPKK